MIDYRSDNTGRAAPEILEALIRANHDTALGYGGDEWTAALQQRFSELFETAVRVFPVATGTAANALGLAALGPSWGIVYCSEAAHINTSEANAAGFFGGGLKLAPVAGEYGRISAERLAETLAEVAPGSCIRGEPAAVNLTQASDLGTVYSLAEIRAVAEVAKARGLKLHMDGARFANAVARLGCSPAEATWRCGIDIMSFGATKNGGALCDAIVVFAPELADGLAVQLRRAGQVWSKMRFASAQLIGLCRKWAVASDGAAPRTRWRRASPPGWRRFPGARLLAPIEVNEIFLELPARSWTRSKPTACVLPPQQDGRALCLPLRRDRGRSRRAARGAAPPSVAARSGASGGVGRYSAASACGVGSGSMPSARL